MAYASSYDSTDIQYYTHPSLTFSDGQTHSKVTVAYRLHGSLTSNKKALIPTCFGGLINSTLSFTSHNQCLSDYLVIVVAMLGNGESSSPSNTQASGPFSGGHTSYKDNINAHYALLRQHLKIEALDAVIGFSMGGQQAYYWAVMYPEYVRNIVIICGSAKTSAHNWTFLEGPKAALMNSSDYDEGRYEDRPTSGLRAFGRAYAGWLASGAWFRERGWEQLGCEDVEGWIRGLEAKYEGWDPRDLLALLAMWQEGDVGRLKESSGEESWKQGLQSVQARVLLMPCRTDMYFAVEDNEAELRWLRKGRLAVIESIWGHMAGAGSNENDVSWMDQEIRTFLNGG